MPGTGASRADARIPVIVVTGFLGSGKTTLLRKLLGHSALADSLVIVNEFGAVGIDHHLLARADDRTVLLENGCLCCAMRGDLQETLVDVGMRRRRGELPGFDRVFVETSGLADPGPVAQTLYRDPALAREYVLQRVVTVVDGTNAGVHGRDAAIAVQQVASADIVVLSKADAAGPQRLAESEAWVRAINAFAECVPAQWGDIDPALLVGHASAAWRSVLHGVRARGPHDGQPAHRQQDITSFALDLEGPVRRAAFDAFLEVLVRLRGPDLLRVKGIVRFEDAPAPVVVQGVRHVFQTPTPLPRAATPPSESILVFIARELALGEVDALWRAIKAVTTAPGP